MIGANVPGYLASFFIVFISIIIPLQTLAAIPKQSISESWRSSFAEIAHPKAWIEFVKKNESVFPSDADDFLNHVTVVKDEIRVNEESFVYGTAYRQIRLKTTFERVAQILKRPDLFKEMFGLDSETHTPVDPLNMPLSFTAKIKKKLPLIVPDQDYEMKYQTAESTPFLFQKVEQLRDNGDFALRETLVVVEKTDSGVLFREVGKVMPLSWAVRALGPQLRQITKSELTKMNEALRCVTESQDLISDQLARNCYR